MEDSLAGMARRRALLGYAFLLPTLLGILVFSVGPAIVSLEVSFFEWDVFDPPVFVGMDNCRFGVINTPAVLRVCVVQLHRHSPLFSHIVSPLWPAIQATGSGGPPATM